MDSLRQQSVNRTALVTCILAFGLAAFASASEVQLAGIRLGQHALHVLQVYGQPDGIIKGAGAGGATPAAAAGAGAGAGAGAASQTPTDEFDDAGYGDATREFTDRASGLGMLGGGGQQRTEATTQPAGGGGAPGPNGGSVGGAPPGPNPFFDPACPDWIAPVWVSMQPEESLWAYRRGAVVLGFVVDRDGYIVSIALAGRKCEWARTAMWDPRRSIKLGDDYKTVIQRYGYPSSTDPVGTQVYDVTMRGFAGSGGGPTAGGIGNAYRDLILHYGFNDNIEFLLQEMKVVRIHIWEPEARPPASRGGGASAGAGAGGDMRGMGGPGMGGMPGGGAPGGMR